MKNLSSHPLPASVGGQAAAAPHGLCCAWGHRPLSITAMYCFFYLRLAPLLQVPCPSMKAPESLPPALQLQCLWPGVWQKARSGGAGQVLANVCWVGFSPGSGSLKGHTLSPCCSPWGIKCNGQELGLRTRLPGPRPWLRLWSGVWLHIRHLTLCLSLLIKKCK